MQTPTVSVIIPNYNYARYLQQRIDSVLRQTFTDYELILLDDASTDNSREILERYKENPKVSHVVINSQNTGSPFRQWFRGIGLASGEYVWVAESDDLAEPDFLETCMRLFRQHPAAAFAYVGSRLMDADGTVSRKDINKWPRKHDNHRIFNGREYARRNLYWRNYTVNASGILFRRDCALKLTESSLIDMRYCGDWLFWFEMSLQGDVIEIHRNLNFWRQHNAKVTVASHEGGAGILEDMHIVREMDSRMQPNAYKRCMRRGMLYRKALRKRLPRTQWDALRTALREGIEATYKDYLLYRINNLLSFFIPALPTRKNERMK